jgi:hypothetical protein
VGVRAESERDQRGPTLNKKSNKTRKRKKRRASKSKEKEKK